MNAGSETGAHVAMTLQQTLSHHHLRVRGNVMEGTGQSNDPLVPEGMAEAHRGPNRTG